MPAPITTRLLDLYRIGPGPSSSHTIGPMRAACAFREAAIERGIVPARLRVELKGSLCSTGHGHGTDRAVLAGLCGWQPDTCDVDALLDLPAALRERPETRWGADAVRLSPDDVIFLPYSAYRDETLRHPNTMVCQVLDADGGASFEQAIRAITGAINSRRKPLRIISLLLL